MSEEEFWCSTWARVFAMYRVQILDWAKTRDYFIAEQTAVYLNCHRSSQSDKLIETEQILACRYPLRPKRHKKYVIDPDRGAGGDWRALRAGFRAKTEAEKRRRAGKDRRR